MPQADRKSFTTGPWRWSPRGTNEHGHAEMCLIDPDESGVLYHSAVWSPTAADVALIASAPDLLKALKMILPLAQSWLKHAPHHPDNGKIADAIDAIAKAEGR